jgi:exosome complex component RRP42
MPISCTAVQIENSILFDPSLDEEKVASARLTVTTDENGDLRAMQKGLKGALTIEQVKSVIETAQRLGGDLRKLVG